jgi:hypothetical protein
LHELGAAELSLQQQLYDIELAKIPIIAAGRRIRDEQDEIYRRIAGARGLSPEAVLINMNTGEVRARKGAAAGAVRTPEEDPTPASE